jgi:ERCC4-related helicase
MRYSNRPSTEVHDFAVTASNLPRGHSFQIYQNVYWQLDLQQDPYIIQLNKEGKLAKIAECILKASTYCQKQLRILLNKGASIQEELGTWASQTYIDECIDLFLSTQEQKSLSFTFSEEENQYLRRVLGRVKAERDQFRSNSKGEGKNEALDFSPKVMKLIEILVKQLSGQTRAIVFVKTRASVALVERILAAATETRDLVRSATFVGTSNSSSRKFNIGELVDVKSQVGALDDLRDGKKNLIISTSVCEEGIDISACNLVICFEKPLHLRSFIQRRGRARAESSKYVIMFRDDERNLRSEWEKLEAEMNNKYANEQRELEQLESLENSEDDDREFVVESTG